MKNLQLEIMFLRICPLRYFLPKIFIKKILPTLIFKLISTHFPFDQIRLCGASLLQLPSKQTGIKISKNAFASKSPTIGPPILSNLYGGVKLNSGDSLISFHS